MRANRGIPPRPETAMNLFAPLAAAVLLALGSANAQAAHVLVVLSDADHLELRDARVYPTGFYLNELMQPVKALRDAGHRITFATPEGRAPTVDRTSIDAAYFGNDPAALKAHEELLAQLKLTAAAQSPVLSLSRVEQIGYGEFDAVYIPGGHAPMQDLLASPALGRLLTDFHTQGKPTALVCHGPIALLSTLPGNASFLQQMEGQQRATAPSSWIYAGYQVTVISNDEEEQAKGALNGGTMKFYPQTALQQAGVQYRSNAQPWQAHVVVDRELITGQNPASAVGVTKALLDKLD